MLRTLSFYDSNLVRIIPDGVFGEGTMEAVMAFQREFHLPVTGTVDNATWDAIVLAWTAAEERMSLPQPTSNLPSWQYSTPSGQASVYLLLSQAIFKALGTVLEGIEPCPADGVNSGACTRNIRWLQRRAGLRESGALGKAEWDALTQLYAVFLLRTPAVRNGHS